MWILQFMQMAQFLQTFFGETVLARLRWWEDLGDQKLTVCSSSIRDCFKGVIPRVSPSSTGLLIRMETYFSYRRNHEQQEH
mmetsp:Transcript_4380/g.6946  ORF Transcript_4380/g.6946 Transcript_4380/m.6946 type:complete len:81 (+) Transcript_4380:1586-1828(+)